MGYCSQTDIANTIPLSVIYQLTCDSGNADHVDTDKLNEAIRKADSIIDGYLRGRFVLPLSTVPAAIRDLSIKLTIYYLYERSLSLTMPESVKWSYVNATKKLTEIQTGMFTPFEQTDNPVWFNSNNQTVIDDWNLITDYGVKYHI
jgi:phage gp36-like protein